VTVENWEKPSHSRQETAVSVQFRLKTGGFRFRFENRHSTRLLYKQMIHHQTLSSDVVSLRLYHQTLSHSGSIIRRCLTQTLSSDVVSLRLYHQTLSDVSLRLYHQTLSDVSLRLYHQTLSHSDSIIRRLTQTLSSDVVSLRLYHQTLSHSDSIIRRCLTQTLSSDHQTLSHSDSIIRRCLTQVMLTWVTSRSKC